MEATGATSGFVGSIDLSRDFTEMSSRLHISGEGAVLVLGTVLGTETPPSAPHDAAITATTSRT